MNTLPHIDGYTIHATIYERNDVVLYHGHRDADQAPVTIKMLRGQYPSLHDVAKLRHEYSILRGLNISGVVKAYALERYGMGPALILEGLTGRALNDLLREERPDLATSLDIGIRLVNILNLLHESNVIHKDIKPHNVLVDQATRQVHLIDFGLATRLSQETQRVTGLDALEGSLAYMSPEQTGRMNRVVDYRSDYYSLGCALYELLTGSLPFATTDLLELVYSHIARMPVPPHVLVPEIPETVSNIIMKLVSKAAEDRYQSARGLLADLEECAKEWSADRRVTPFPLGRHDTTGALHIPQKLYGRSEQIAELLSAFESASEGGADLLFVSGYSGVGKSALVNEVHKSIARRGGYFIAGKFDQVNRNIPYAPIVQAFRGLIRQLLTERAESLRRWKEEIQAALGSNGKLLTDLFPELDLLLGPQPDVPPLGPSESQQRFNLTFQKFLHVFTSAKQPLVVFLDDLQWVDAASLKLLQVLLTDPERGYLLIIGAYRDNEVDQGHMLMVAQGALREDGIRSREIILHPLSLPDVTALLADTLLCDEPTAKPLAEAVFRKTQGNPFFVDQFLRAIHRDKLLVFDAASGHWSSSLDRIRQYQATENVVEFMVNRIRRIDPAAQRALKFAACIGHQFSFRALAVIGERSLTDTAASLWELLQDGLIQPLDAEYRFLHSDGFTEDLASSEDFNVSYKFLHDRVQQAAYSLTDESDKPALHLRIGRLMLASSSGDGAQRDEGLFSTVNHLNLGAALITDPSERASLARLNLTTGARAKVATAYAAAARYFGAGVALLDDKSWDEDYELCFTLHFEQSECEYLNDQLDRAEPLADLLMARARSALERARICNLRVVIYSMRRMNAEAVAAGLEGLRLFDVVMPDAPGDRADRFAKELIATETNLGERRVADLINDAEITDPNERLKLLLLYNLLVPSNAVDLNLYGLLVLKQVNLSIQHGRSDVSAIIYVGYAWMLACVLGRYAKAQEFGELALAIDEKYHDPKLAAKVHVVLGMCLHHFKDARLSIHHYERAIQAALESGDFEYLSYAVQLIVTSKFFLGHELSAVDAEATRHLALLNRIKVSAFNQLMMMIKQAVACLEGRTRSRVSLSDDHFDEDELIAQMSRDNDATGRNRIRIIKMQLCFLHGEHRRALDIAAEVDPIPSYLETREAPFYASLAALALLSTAPDAERGDYESIIDRYYEMVVLCEKECPESFQHKRILIDAERARIQGRHRDAAELYDNAIALAQKSDAVREEALASELCARFYMDQQRSRLAAAYMSDAHYHYLRWGATAKADEILKSYPHLVSPTSQEQRPMAASSSSTSTPRRMGEALDVTAAMRAAQAIASEIVLDRVLDQVMRIMATNAGADKGALILDRDGDFVIDVTMVGRTNVILTGVGAPLESSKDLPASVVHYVARTGEILLAEDAYGDPRFTGDAYIETCRPKSILCVPMAHQGRLTGILYLENNVASHVFTPQISEFMRMLSSQAASAVENALLYARVQAMTDQLKGSNEELTEANRRLEVELLERERAEEERAELQREVIRVQSARLAEMSTPLIPISDHIMIMPLIGTMEEQRARQALETALNGTQRNRARVVIIDITGVRHIDVSVASTLVNTANALRLLGAETVLTGIGAEIARSMMEFNIDLGGIVTRGTLQSGIAYALGRTGESWRAEGGNPLGRSAMRRA